IGSGDRLDVPALMEQVRTQQSSLRFFKQDAGVPSVRQMRSPAVTEAVLARGKRFAVSERSRLSANEIVHVHAAAKLAADHIGIRGCRQPFIERSALVRLKMAEADVAQLG